MRALRVLVGSVAECYGALSWVHSHFSPIAEEFDDYIVTVSYTHLDVYKRQG